MTLADELGDEVPTYSQCVVGYRAWLADGDDALWPIGDHRCAWAPGINTARCNCDGSTDSLRFTWTVLNGRRVLEPAPLHEAPAASCQCGLYAWRRPDRLWRSGPPAYPDVLGAVACWGALQVHDAGFRAQFACVIALACPPRADDQVRAALERISTRYGVELVAPDELQEAALQHGAPLPEQVGPPVVAPHPEAGDAAPLDVSLPVEPAPDATPEEVGSAIAIGPDGRPRKPKSWSFGGGYGYWAS